MGHGFPATINTHGEQSPGFEECNIDSTFEEERHPEIVMEECR